MSIDQRLSDLGITLPQPAAPVAAYVPAVEQDGLLHISGQISFAEDGSLIKGRLGEDIGIDDGVAAARRCGIMLLAQIKADGGLKTIPTLILTTSEAEADITKSYQLQANCFLSKPVQLEAFESLVKSINDFWLTKAKLPHQGDRP